MHGDLQMLIELIGALIVWGFFFWFVYKSFRFFLAKEYGSLKKGIFFTLSTGFLFLLVLILLETYNSFANASYNEGLLLFVGLLMLGIAVLPAFAVSSVIFKIFETVKNKNYSLTSDN